MVWILHFFSFSRRRAHSLLSTKLHFSLAVKRKSNPKTTLREHEEKVSFCHMAWTTVITKKAVKTNSRYQRKGSKLGKPPVSLKPEGGGWKVYSCSVLALFLKQEAVWTATKSSRARPRTVCLFPSFKAPC